MKHGLVSTCLPAFLLLSCSAHPDPRLEREAEGLIHGKRTRAHSISVQELRAYAHAALLRTRRIQGYRCTVYKRERVHGELGGTQKAKLEIRHEPFSVHIRFLEPASVAGEEAIYVAGQNDGKILAHATGILGWLGTVRLDPKGSRAMQGNRYPITEAGLLNLLERFVEVCDGDTVEHCTIGLQEGVLVDGRGCDRVALIEDRPAADPGFSRLLVLVDHDAGVLVHFELHALGRHGGEVLIERHTFTDLELDPGLTDRDFDPDNPAYGY